MFHIWIQKNITKKLRAIKALTIYNINLYCTVVQLKASKDCLQQ